MADTIIINKKEKSRLSASRCFSDFTECLIYIPRRLVARSGLNQKRMKHAGIHSIKLY